MSGICTPCGAVVAGTGTGTAAGWVVCKPLIIRQALPRLLHHRLEVRVSDQAPLPCLILLPPLLGVLEVEVTGHVAKPLSPRFLWGVRKCFLAPAGSCVSVLLH